MALLYQLKLSLAIYSNIGYTSYLCMGKRILGFFMPKWSGSKYHTYQLTAEYDWIRVTQYDIMTIIKGE